MDYPSLLSSPLRAGHGINPEQNIVRTTMVSGRERQRTAYTSVPAYTELSWTLTAQQAQLFESWVGAIGGDWFNVRLKTPLGYDNHECRFIESPQGPKLTGVDLWSYGAKVEIKDRPPSSTYVDAWIDDTGAMWITDDGVVWAGVA